MKQLTQLAEWQLLKTHYQETASQDMRNLFAEDPERFKRFSLKVNNLLLDYSKNRITTETLDLLCQLAHAKNLKNKIEELFSGNSLNTTEQRAALHTALRALPDECIKVNGHNIVPDIHANLTNMRKFTEQVRTQAWLGATGKPIQHIVNIGIGGSHLGPEMSVHALSDFATPSLRFYFISNMDSSHLYEILHQIDPETTLFIVSSKSFTTLETITNLQTIRHWLQTKLSTANLTNPNLANHFVAVTAAKQKALEFGIPVAQIFPVWDWVGGRYSVWSAIGLPLALSIGMDNFMEFLAGARAMDEHFRSADFSANMPVILALLGVWYINFFGAQTHAIIPYTHQLNYFRAHMQQLDMESNGKRTTLSGSPSDYPTGSIIWGEHGCNGQHAFHQLLHQGQHVVPVDFILVGKNNTDLEHHQDILIASGLSQAQALLAGKSFIQALEEVKAQGLSGKEAEWLAKHKEIPGNRPSNVLFLNKMTPYNLGSLLALYEHKVFVQGIIWDINSFDQWGVELGKQLLPQILNDIENTSINSHHDTSTSNLIHYYKTLRNSS
jgi:glucose-6-phosphate isomerase